MFFTISQYHSFCVESVDERAHGQGYRLFMAAVVLQGPANTAPEVIIGPFDSLRDAEDWARKHPRAGGYSVAQELTAAAEFPAGEETLRLRLDSAGLLAGPGALRSR
jgi:hypothetical protein